MQFSFTSKYGICWNLTDVNTKAKALIGHYSTNYTSSKIRQYVIYYKKIIGELYGSYIY